MATYDIQVEPGQTHTINITGVADAPPDPEPEPEEIQFWRVDPATDDRDGGELVDGDEVSRPLNVEVTCEGAASIGCYVNGTLVRVENTEPFAVFGDTAGDFVPANVSVGPLVLKAIAYPQDDAAGTPIGERTITIDVIDTLPEPGPIPVPGTPQNVSGIARPAPRAGFRRAAQTEFAATIPLGQWREDENKVLKYRGDDWWPDSREKNMPGRGGRYSSKYTTSQHDGVLDIWLHAQKDGGDYFKHDGSGTELGTTFLVNAPVTFIGKRTEMDIHVIAKFPMVAWAKAAWLLWASGTNVNGEEDWPEMRFDDGIGAKGFHHFARAEKGQAAFDGGNFKNTDFQLYTLRWKMNGFVEFLRNNVRIGYSTQYMPDEPMQYIMQTETLLANEPILPKTNGVYAQGHVLVDWFAIDVPV